MGGRVRPPTIIGGLGLPVEAPMISDRRALIERAATAGVVLVLGESDTGKTTLVCDLANAFLGRGLSVAIVDADIGQSEIGPPMTIGLGRVPRPLTRPSDAEPIALRFVGATSAAREQVATVVGTQRLVARALRLGFDRVIVDTSGLVRGELGQRLKQAKIDAIAPDLVVALQRAGECEPILRGYAGAEHPSIARLPAIAAPRRRTPEDRRRHRERALAAHLAGARAVRLDLSRVGLRTPALYAGPPIAPEELASAADAAGQELVWAERRGGEVAVVTRTMLGESEARALARRLGAVGFVHHALDALVGMLAGLDDAALDTLGLGVVTAIDFPAGTMALETAVGPERIAAVAIGRERYRRDVSETGADALRSRARRQDEG